MADPPKTRRRRTVTRLATVVIAIGLVAAMSVGAWAVSRPSPVPLRTAVVSRADVEQTLRAVGTVEAPHRADVAFATSGTVATVHVSAGQTVAAGETLATLETTALTDAVTKAKAAVATAAAKLATDKTAQADQLAQAAAAARAKAAAAAKTAATARAAAQAAAATAAETAKRTATASRAQRLADSSLATARRALSNQTTLCDSAAVAPASSPVTAAKGAAPRATTCSAALVEVAAAQQSAARAQTTLQQALAALSKDSGLSGPGGRQGSGTPAAGAAGAAGSTSASTASSGGGASSREITAADFAEDQAAIDRSKAGLTTAELNLKAGRLTSPFAGMVADISVAAGESVSRAVSVATIVGRGAATVSVAVPESDVRAVHVGQDVALVPDGSTLPIHAKVSTVATTASASASTSATVTFAVTIDIPASRIPLALGTRVAVSITTRKAAGAITAPTSAVRRVAGTNAVVTTLARGKAAIARVTIGAIGSERTEIVSGLEVGAVVVVADPNQLLPSNTTNRGLGAGGGPGFAPVPGQTARPRTG